MNKDQVLQLQAWVDGELSASEARRVAEWVRGSLEAQALVEELRATQSLLAANEPEVCLPAAESPEFYWNKIQRAIAREEAVSAMTQARSGLPRLLAWRRVLAPASGLALVAFLSVLSLNLYQQRHFDESVQHLVEVENLSEHVGSISYKSQSENMFVVYLYNKDQEPELDDEFDVPPADPGVQ